MKLRIYTDTHLFSPMRDITSINKIEKSYFIGDIVDLANVKKKDYKNAMLNYSHLKPNSKGWIDGNHERVSITNDVIRIENTLLVHGDFEAWGDKRAIKYRSKKHTAGWFKRNIWVRALKNFEKLVKHVPKKKMIDRLVSHAKFRNCDTIICGHRHPRTTYDKMNEGVRVVVLKRGLSEIDV